MIASCTHCAKQFAVSPKTAGKFCSRDCYFADLAVKGRPHQVSERTEFSCAACTKSFSFAAGQLRAYRKSWGKDPKYCSRACAWSDKRLTAEEFKEKGRTCLNCGQALPVVYRNGTHYLDLRRKVCDKKCRDELHAKTMLDAHADRIPEPFVGRHGYLRMTVRKDPNKKAVEVLQHRYVMEQHIGRPLRKDETVHHINGDRLDNRLENLQLRQGKHGSGTRVVCLDCGSHNIGTVPL